MDSLGLVSAFVQITHRRGDANVRAVCLFSRNDAISNVVVVAVVIAGLFRQSLWPIVRDARSDLEEAGQ